MSQKNIEELSEVMRKIISDRDWDQFHGIQNLIMNLVRESTELMEPFIWKSPEEAIETLKTKRNEIKDEIGDVFFVLLAICNKTNIDLAQAFLDKMKKLEAKYPIEKCKGKNLKYNEL